MNTILSVQSSARYDGSHSRSLSATLIEKLVANSPGSVVIDRDVAADMPLINAEWLAANWTPANDRTPEQAQRLALSDQLIGELENADVLVLGVPMYNFAMPASLKAWIDLVARAGRTFAYTENGPKGLLEGKKAYVVITSGGVPLGSAYDFTSGYIKHVLSFIGIEDVTIISADQLVNNETESLSRASDAIAKIAA
ncbi:MAG: NAD(P)H-dependent oxidoreductase [Ahrensia sp.]